MAETWPAPLQDKLNENGFSLQIGNTTLRSEMDIGPAKVRKRVTRPVDVLTATINVTIAQYSEFRTFFDTTLAGGSKTFDFDDPITGASTEYRFVQEPSISVLGGGNFQISMTWEKIS